MLGICIWHITFAFAYYMQYATILEEVRILKNGSVDHILRVVCALGQS